MSAMVDFLVEEQHAAIDAPRPKFAAVMTGQTLMRRSPALAAMYDATYCVRPALGWVASNDVPFSAAWFETNDRAEAEMVAQTMLFCGAYYVLISHYNTHRTAETVERWEAVQS